MEISRAVASAWSYVDQMIVFEQCFVLQWSTIMITVSRAVMDVAMLCKLWKRVLCQRACMWECAVMRKTWYVLYMVVTFVEPLEQCWRRTLCICLRLYSIQFLHCYIFICSGNNKVCDIVIEVYNKCVNVWTQGDPTLAVRITLSSLF